MGDNLVLMPDVKDKTILVVDDSNITRSLIERVYKDQYKILMASNGREAIDIVDTMPEGVLVAILLDLNMPDLDGFAVLDHFKEKDLFNKIILINPVSLQQLKCIPDKSIKFKQNIINLPIIGTFIYNKLMSPIKVDLLFRNKFISRGQLISDNMKDAYYESAHKGQSRGKYLYSSILSNYINTNIAPALKNLDKDVSIIASTGIKNNMDVINNYHKLNSKCDIIHIANAKLYPQLELPEKTASIIKKIVTN